MSDHEDEHTIAEDIVVTKYKMVGDIVNRILKKIITKCVAGASVRELCKEGDLLIEEETSSIFKREKDMKKGIAFPVCMSINNCINHYSPLTSDTDSILQDGDLVKIDFGAHLDGFIGVVGHTVVVGATKENKVTGRKADVMLAAYYAAEAALRLIRPGNQNYMVTDIVTKITDEFKCKPVEGMLSFQLQQGRIDGEKTIIQNPSEAQRKEVEKCDFETNDVFGIDVIVSTGEGIGREMESRVTIYRKTEEVYSLKLKASKEFYRKVKNSYGTMPFNLRSFEDEKKARMGVVECVTHKLVEQYPVVWEKPNEFVAQFKYTVLLKPNGPHRITGLPFDVDAFQSEHSIKAEDLKKVVTGSVNIKPKSSKKKKKKNTDKKPETT